MLSLGHPVIPNIEGREHIITSDDAFFLEKLPKKVTIVGRFLFF
jgi:glutathione reductase (NADPH)